MTFGFTPRAERELAFAVEYYEAFGAELSERLTQEVLATIMRLVEYPKSGPRVRGEIRRMVLPRFPFSVLYRVDDDLGHLTVLAVMHPRKDPTEIT